MFNEWKRAFLNPKLFISAAIIFMSSLLFSLPTMLELPSLYTDPIYYPSAMYFALDSVYFGGFILLVPLCASLVHVDKQVDEVQWRYILWQVQRSGIKKYCFTKVAVTCLSGAAGVILGYGLYVTLCNILYLPSNPDIFETHFLYYEGTIYENMYKIAGGLPMYGYVMLAMSIACMMWAIIGLAAAVWIPDKLVAVTIPLCIHYMWTYGIRSVPSWQNTIPSPSQLFNDGLTLSTMGRTLIVYFGVMLVALFVYMMGVKRRVKNA